MKNAWNNCAVWLIMILLVSGCAAKDKSPAKVFFPPPPDEPRLEWLTTIASLADFPAKKGGFVESFLGENRANFFSGPFGVASTHDGQILVGDLYQRKISRLNLAEAKVEPFTSAGFDNNLGMAVDAQDRVYVADGKSQKVLVFSADGQPLRAIGDKQLFTKPAYLAVNDRLSRLYVSDALEHDIKVFTLEGEFLFRFGKKGSQDGQLYAPQGMAIDSGGRLFVADMLNARIQVFSADGEFVNKFGERGQFEHQFESPKDLAFDSEDNLYIVDSRRPNFRIFTPDGNLLLVIGGKKRSKKVLGFSMPMSVFVDGSDRVIITDFLNRTVTIWQYLSAAYKARASSQGNEVGK